MDAVTIIVTLGSLIGFFGLIIIAGAFAHHYEADDKLTEERERLKDE
jgi:hypothetical protein